MLAETNGFFFKITKFTSCTVSLAKVRTPASLKFDDLEKGTTV
jgi:hypothetical protein